MYKFIVKGRLPSLNEYTAANRANVHQGAKMKRQYQSLVLGSICSQIPDVAIYGRAKIHFRWYEPNTRRDIDNICWAKKILLDALVEAGTIPDDSQKYVTAFTDEVFVDKDNPRIEVELEEY